MRLTPLFTLAGVLCLPAAVGNAQEASRWQAPQGVVPEHNVFRQIRVVKVVGSGDDRVLAILEPQTVVESREQAYTVMIPIQETRSEGREVDGRSVEEERVVTRMVPETRTRIMAVAKVVGTARRDIPFRDAEVWTLEGERLESQEAAERLARPAHVLVVEKSVPSPSEANRAIPPYYRSVLRDDLLMVVVPSGMSQPPSQAPTPQAPTPPRAETASAGAER